MTEFGDDRDPRARDGLSELGGSTTYETDESAVEYEDGFGPPKKRQKIRIKAWHIILLLTAVVACIALAYWQWTRFQSGSGTFQNLGYAFQWPLFALFFVYAYRMGVKYENQAIEAKNEANDPDFLYEADLAEFGEEERPVTEIDHDFLPPRPSLDIDEFNEINAPRRGHDSGNGRPHEAEDKHLNI